MVKTEVPCKPAVFQSAIAIAYIMMLLMSLRFLISAIAACHGSAVADAAAAPAHTATEARWLKAVLLGAADTSAWHAAGAWPGSNNLGCRTGTPALGAAAEREPGSAELRCCIFIVCGAAVCSPYNVGLQVHQCTWLGPTPRNSLFGGPFALCDWLSTNPDTFTNNDMFHMCMSGCMTVVVQGNAWSRAGKRC